MCDDVDAAHLRESRCSQACSARGRRQIGPNKLDASNGLRVSAGGGDHPGAAGQEAFDGGTAQALSAAADDYPLSRELGRISRDAHSVISSVLMTSFSSVKS